MTQVAVSANYSEQHGLGALRPLVPTWLQVMGGPETSTYPSVVTGTTDFLSGPLDCFMASDQDLAHGYSSGPDIILALGGRQAVHGGLFLAFSLLQTHPSPVQELLHPTIIRLLTLNVLTTMDPVFIRDTTPGSPCFFGDNPVTRGTHGSSESTSLLVWKMRCPEKRQEL